MVGAGDAASSDGARPRIPSGLSALPGRSGRCSAATTSSSVVWSNRSYHQPTAPRLPGSPRADDLGVVPGQHPQRVGVTHRDGAHQPRRVLHRHRVEHRRQRRPGGDAVVDHHGDRRPPRSIGTGPPGSARARRSSSTRSRSMADFDPLGGDPHAGDQVVVEPRLAAFTDGADRQLGIAGSGQLAAPAPRRVGAESSRRRPPPPPPRRGVRRARRRGRPLVGPPEHRRSPAARRSPASTRSR